MKYFHRTTVTPDAALAEAAHAFGRRLTPSEAAPRHRVFSGSLGTVTVRVRAEGGHYTLVTVTTDQPGESELDKLAKRYLGDVHVLAEPDHILRGAY
jgi:hypothetical protein